MKKPVLTLTSLLLVAQLASAHTSGHNGGILETANHFISQPNHLLFTCITLLSVALLLGASRSALNKRK